MMCILAFMSERRVPTATVGSNLAAAVASSSHSLDTLAAATGLATEDLRAFIRGDADMNVADLVRVGGFLHVGADELIGAA
jgi:hypothetical protein